MIFGGRLWILNGWLWILWYVICFMVISILASFCVWTKSLKCKDAVNKDSTFRVMSVVSACKSEEFQVTCQPSGRSSHPVRTTCHPVRTPDRPASFVQTKCSFRPDPILYREVSVPACIRPDVSAARPDASQYSISFWFLSKFQEREDQSTVRTMWYPIRTRVEVRQESQFKYDRPDVWQLWSWRTCIKEGNCRFDFNRLDDCLSWSRREHYRYGNCVLKNSRPDAHPPWSGRWSAL
jgi:hypothetical protein